MTKIIPLVFCAVLFGGCATTKIINPGREDPKVTRQLGYRDFEEAADELLGKILESGALTKPDGGRYVMAVDRIYNRTTQSFDTDLLTKKIRATLLKSGKVVMTAAVSGTGAEDSLVSGIGGQNMVEPELSLSGKIISQTPRISRSKQRIETYFQLSITDIKTGLVFWEDEKIIIKEGARGASW